MKHLLCPSINCAPLDYLRDEVRALDEAGGDIFHLDICDGDLSPRWGMGIRDLECVKRNTDKPVDAHLYIKNPYRHIEAFVDAGADIIYVFPEAEYFIARSLRLIRELGRSPGLCVGWGASVEMLTSLLPLADYVLVNTCDPVSKKRTVMETAWPTLEKLVERKRDYPFKILLDGAVSPEVIVRAARMGVDGFLLGTQCLFDGKPGTYKEKMDKIRASIGDDLE